nr:probable flavin-containing monooxygenase 1 [Tanacetum cinerariifolium]
LPTTENPQQPLSTIEMPLVNVLADMELSGIGEEGGLACTMVVRTLHWTVPHYSVWGLPFYLFYSTRFSQFRHQSPNQGPLRTLLYRVLSPAADKGKINFKRASNWWFYKGGVEFEDNTKPEADVVLLATGYDDKKKLRDVMPQPFLSFLEFPSGMMPLYRGMINPFIPNMAFMGYVESVSILHTSEMRCKWLARLIGVWYLSPTKEWTTKNTGHGSYERGFVQFVYEPIKQTWLPAANALLEMMILHLPSPCTAKKYHVENLYEDVQTDVVAKEALEGHCIYDGGFCKLRISYSRHIDLSIKVQNEFSKACEKGTHNTKD